MQTKMTIAFAAEVQISVRLTATAGGGGGGGGGERRDSRGVITLKNPLQPSHVRTP